MSEQFTFFWRTDSPFSQWHPSNFVVDGCSFCCAEQYMMYRKAVLFGDEDAARRILASKQPAEHKRLGRRVKNFDGQRWESCCQQIVYEGNRAKFTQNSGLKKKLLATRGTTLVEASPTDTIWGVGLAEDDPDIQVRSRWRGKNWLGQVLTRLRDELLKEEEGGGA